ncbi:hypothetical protein [Caedibacter taeniospiralis]|jgi:hypothetical protein|uniref:hypothetical protein n=1 Tax=Caedibacter taeniospiralis TaxID=28907 RepID=UPI0037C176EE
MKSIAILLLALGLYAQVFADNSLDNSNNPYGSNTGEGNATTNPSPDSSNTNQTNQQLLQEMNKKTSKGLKVFDKLLQDDGQSKEDFFADVGRNPTAEQFEGGDGSDAPAENPFAKILGDDSQSN